MSKAKSAPAKQPRRASQRRASQRKVISINLADRSLQGLMVEQCKDGYNYLTVYRGSRAEMGAAGVPEAAFPKEGSVAKFQVQTLNACCTVSHELLSGSMHSTAAGFELEVDWGTVRPYLQGSHPAICELARMLMKDVDAWIDWRSDTPDLARPMEMLAADPRSDYKPPRGSPRLEVTAEFHKKLSDYASELYQFVFTHCEVIQSADTAVASPRPSPLRLIVDNTGRA